jgi:hypothetical protein
MMFSYVLIPQMRLTLIRNTAKSKPMMLTLTESQGNYLPLALTTYFYVLYFGNHIDLNNRPIIGFRRL